MRMSSSPIKQLAVWTSIIALGLLCAMTSSGQQTVNPDPKANDKPSAAITGRVVSRGGEPIAGATVYVSSVGGGGAPSITTAVDGAGTFKISGLSAGLYRVSAGLPGYVPDPPPDSPRYYHEGDDVTITLIKGGVITGKVTTAADEPVIAASVRAYRIRDESGKAAPSFGAVRERATDDRGIYRIYGLPPGTYVVSAGGSPRLGGSGFAGHDNDVPIYAPASTRDTAAEISVNSGEEASADIQYHADSGHSVSGTLSGFSQNQAQPFFNGAVSLLDVSSRSSLMNAPVALSGGAAFAFSGVPDGEYQIYASQYQTNESGLSSEPLHVKVAGADVTGLKVTLAPTASIEGRVVLEKNIPPLNCGKRRDTAIKEVIVSAGRFEPEGKPATGAVLPFMNTAAEGIPSSTGVFALRSLQHGTYAITPRAPAFGWYVRSITIGTATRVLNVNVPRDGITLKSGDRVTGLTVAMAEGGAALRGRISAREGQKLPRELRVYLAPAERESVDNVLVFYEGRTESDGSFAIGNVAPGRYWIVARPILETDANTRPIRQDSALRSQVLAEAQAPKKEVTLRPCEQLNDFELHYTPANPRNQ
jgi:Carboxypeptidase regulatory-like domain